MKLIDLTGKKFGYLEVLAREGQTSAGKPSWRCKCHWCGNDSFITDSGTLLYRKQQRCGKCARIEDIRGKKFGRLTAKYVNFDKSAHSKDKSVFWHCICDCGKELDVSSSNLNSGHTKSCGCYKLDVLTKYTNELDSKIAHKLAHIKYRCNNPNSHLRKWYYNKGITVCDEWSNDPSKFVAWYKSQPRFDPKNLLEIDRIDNNLGYSPENCRLATDKEQLDNRSCTRWIDVDGIKHTSSEWVDILGMSVCRTYFSSMSLRKGIEFTRSFIRERLSQQNSNTKGLNKMPQDDSYYQDVICIAHCDLDGYCSAAVVKRKYPQCHTFIFTNYGRDLPNYAFVKNSKMIVTDFSLQPADMQKCKNLNIEVIWIDHHASNINRLREAGWSAAGLQTPERCGAYLAWQYFFPNEPIPRVIQHVDDYDRWVFSLQGTKELQAGLSLFELRSNYKSCRIWDTLLGDNQEVAQEILDNVRLLGEKNLKYTEARNRVTCNELTYIAEFQGKRIAIANTKQGNSTFFDSFDKTNIDAVCMIQYGADIMQYRASLYSPDNIKEVLPIAESLGGGGHPKACGFQSKTFILPQPTPAESVPYPQDIENVINEYSKVSEMRNSVVVNQGAIKGDILTLRAGSFRTMLNGYRVFAINHPYITDLVRVLPSTLELLDTSTGAEIDALYGFVLTKSGFYRNSIYYTNVGNHQVDDVSTDLGLDKDTPMTLEVLGKLGYVYHWYSRKLPITLS